MLKLILVVCLGGAVLTSGCAWKQIVEGGDVSRQELQEIIKRFEAFSKHLEDEQANKRDVPLTRVYDDRFRLGFLIEIAHPKINVITEEDAKHVYPGKYEEGYDAFREWWRGLDKPPTLRFGGHELTQEDYEHLRYYEIEFSHEVVFGHPFYEEIMEFRERVVPQIDRLKLIALYRPRDGTYILDVRRSRKDDNDLRVRQESVLGYWGRYFLSILNAILGNGPANMAPTPKVQ